LDPFFAQTIDARQPFSPLGTGSAHEMPLPEVEMIQQDLQQIRLGYLRGVLSERWPVPPRIPTLLAFSRDSNVTAVTFGRLGFRVEEISSDDPPESLRQQLPGRKACFDVVCCWDLLEHCDDWPDVVAMLARALRSGGVFFYSVSGRMQGNRRELKAVLRKVGLSPQRMAGLRPGVGSGSLGPTMRNGVVSQMGYAFQRRDRSAELAGAA
jgi:SAM-dependent methyltransferase